MSNHKITIGGGGRTFDLLSPRVEDVNIRDIATSLSRLNRWLGHSLRPISVAQHCWLVSKILELEGHGDLALQGLLHDAGEAYCADIPSDLKKAPGMEAYRAIEDRILAVILEAFGEPTRLHDMIHVVDKRSSANEAVALFDPPPSWVGKSPLYRPYDLKGMGLSIHPWDATRSFDMYLHRFSELTFWKTRAA